jgi:hypothetical protein
MKLINKRAKIVLIVAFLAVAALLIWHQESRFNEAQAKQAAKQQADACAQFFLQGDFKSLIAKVPKKVVDAMGGPDAASRIMQGGIASETFQGFLMQSIAVGDVQQIEVSQSHVFALLPEVIDISMPQGFMRAESFFVGVSDDNGRTWSFMDSAGLQALGNPQKIFPDFPIDLSIPPKAKPVVLCAKVTDPGSATRPLEEVAFTSMERAYFKVKVPKGSTIVPPEKDLDVDHYTELTLSDESAVVLQVLDDKDISSDVLNRMVDTARKRLSDPTNSPSDLFDTLHGSGTIVTGTVFLIPHCVEVGRFEGNKRAYIVIADYLKEDQDLVHETLRIMLSSFQIKE